MAKKPDNQREKVVTREVHRLFWRAMLQTKLYFTLTVVLHIPVFLVMSVYVPLQIAYGIQAIITRRTTTVGCNAAG